MSSGTWGRDASAVVRLEIIVTRVCEEAPEADRIALLAELSELLGSPDLPPSAREVGLELAGKLARRATSERPCQSGLGVMLQRIRRHSA